MNNQYSNGIKNKLKFTWSGCLMAINKNDLERIAKLAKLSFSDAEKTQLTKELAQIIAYVDKLNELDLENITASSHVLDLKNIAREDEQKSWLTQQEALMNAPASHGKFFSVPKVISIE